MIPMIVGSGSMVLCQCLWWSSVTVRPLTCELWQNRSIPPISTPTVSGGPTVAGWHGCETSGSCGIMWDLVSEVVFLSALDLCNTAGPGEVASSWSSLDTSAFHRSGEHGQNPRISWRYSFFSRRRDSRAAANPRRVPVWLGKWWDFNIDFLGLSNDRF